MCTANLEGFPEEESGQLRQDGAELGGLEPYTLETNVQTKYGQLMVLFPSSLSRMVHRRGEAGPSTASEYRGFPEALSVWGVARKGREAASRSRRGPPEAPKRENVCVCVRARVCVCLNTLYVLATELVSILSCQ